MNLHSKKMTTLDDGYISRVSRAYIFFHFFSISSYRTAFLSNKFSRQIANRYCWTTRTFRIAPAVN